MKNVKIFAKTIESEAKEQIEKMAASKAYRDCQIRIMPDCHAGKGCTVGTVIELCGKVVPNTVGVDIGCGMHVVDLGFSDIDLPLLDRIINDNIPSGFNVHEKPLTSDLVDLMQYEITSLLPPWKRFFDMDYTMRSLGTLGGGNHFIEVDVDNIGRKYLVIHSGSRNLGVRVCNHYQQLAVEECDNSMERNIIIAALKAFGRQDEIEDTLRQGHDLHQWSYAWQLFRCHAHVSDVRRVEPPTYGANHRQGSRNKGVGRLVHYRTQLYRHLRWHHTQGSCERKAWRASDNPSEHARRFASVYRQGQRRLASVSSARCRQTDVALGGKEAAQHGGIPTADARHLLHIGMRVNN